MIFITFVMLFLVAFIYYFKFKVRSKKLVYKHNFLLTLSRFIEKKDDIENIKNKYPHFYTILSNVYNISISNIAFETIEKNSKNINKDVLTYLNNEFDEIYKNGSTEDIELLNLYLVQNMELYFYKNAYKFEILSMILKVSLFLPKRRMKEKVEKENLDKIEYCIV